MFEIPLSCLDFFWHAVYCVFCLYLARTERNFIAHLHGSTDDQLERENAVDTALDLLDMKTRYDRVHRGI